MSHGTAEQHDDAVPWIDLELNLRQQTPREWAKHFKDASANEANRMLIVLSRFATNTQIRHLFHILDRRHGNQAEWLQHWRTLLTQLSPRIFSESTRYKPCAFLGEDHLLIHYKRVDSPKNRRTARSRQAVIGFTGNAGLLMAPLSCILATLADTPYDLIVIRRRHKQSYFDKDGQLLKAINSYLRSELRDSLRDSISLGTSNGGVAALCMAQSLRLSLGIAIGAAANADTFQRGQPVAKATQRLQRLTWRFPWQKQKTELLVAASANHQQDAENARLTSNHFNCRHRKSARATTLLMNNCESHNLIHELSGKGISLDHFLLPALNQALNSLPSHQRHPHEVLIPTRTAKRAQSERPKDLRA